MRIIVEAPKGHDVEEAQQLVWKIIEALNERRDLIGTAMLIDGMQNFKSFDYTRDVYIFESRVEAPPPAEKIRFAIENLAYPWVEGWDYEADAPRVKTLREFYESTWQGHYAEELFTAVTAAVVGVLDDA